MTLLASADKSSACMPQGKASNTLIVQNKSI